MALDPDKIMQWPFDPVRDLYDQQRTILYALGVGAGATGGDLELIYERCLKALPTMAAILAPDGPWMTDPCVRINFAQVLHGEQKLQIHAPLPPEGAVIGQTSIDGLYDKGPKGAVLVIKRDLRGLDGDLIATSWASAVLRADGGFGGSSAGQPVPRAVPDRAPDLCVTLPTARGQANLYRLSGDTNPLHIDPEAAKAAGFERPILHGLCGYGMVARAVIGGLCDNDPHRLRRFDVRFSAPVYPGETLSTEIWRESAGQAAFRTRVVERDAIAINNGYAEYLP